MSFLSQLSPTSSLPDSNNHDPQQKELLDLPIEILLLMASYLAKSSWRSLRLVSRSFCAVFSNLPVITKLWFSPHSEPSSIFMSVSNDPILNTHVRTILYDITRFEDFSLEELRRVWPKWTQFNRRAPYRQKREVWTKSHPGIWQYLKLVEEQNSFDEVATFAEGLRKLPNVRTVRLAFSFQWQHLLTKRTRMSPLRMYSDVELIRQKKSDSKTEIPMQCIRTIFEAITKSGVEIKGLDFWQDDISVPLYVFNFKEGFEDLPIIFSRLTSLTIKVSISSMCNLSDVLSFRSLLERARELRKLHLWIDIPATKTYESERDDLILLFEDLTVPQLRELDSTWPRPPDTTEPLLHIGIHDTILQRLDLPESDNNQQADSVGDKPAIKFERLLFPHLHNISLKGIYTSGKVLYSFLRRHELTVRRFKMEGTNLGNHSRESAESFRQLLRIYEE